MAANKKKDVLGYDPLAWLGEEPEELKTDDMPVETESESVISNEALTEEGIDTEQEVYQEQPVELDSIDESENFANDIELPADTDLLMAEDPEVDMNTLTDIPKSPVSDEATSEEPVSPVIDLDMTLTIQHVVELYELIKKSYLAHDSIEINAADVSSIDTSTLQMLVALRKDAVKQQKQVIITKPSRRFIESAELLGVLEILDIDPAD